MFLFFSFFDTFVQRRISFHIFLLIFIMLIYCNTVFLCVMVGQVTGGSYPCTLAGFTSAVNTAGSNTLSCTSSSPTITLTDSIYVSTSGPVSVDFGWGTFDCKDEYSSIALLIVFSCKRESSSCNHLLICSVQTFLCKWAYVSHFRLFFLFVYIFTIIIFSL